MVKLVFTLFQMVAVIQQSKTSPSMFQFCSSNAANDGGHYVADIVPIFGSINMIGGERPLTELY